MHKIGLNLLSLYEVESSQQINLNKSSITFIANTPYAVRSQICSLLEVVEKDSRGTYLRLSSRIGWKKKEVFSYVKDVCRNDRILGSINHSLE